MNKYQTMISHGPILTAKRQKRVGPTCPPSARVVHNQRQLDEQLDQHPKASLYAEPLGIGQGPRFFRHFEYVDSEVANVVAKA